MSTSIVQAYTDYLVSVNKMIYNTGMEVVKTTQEFATEAAKIHPFKDMWSFLDMNSSKKQK